MAGVSAMDAMQNARPPSKKKKKKKKSRWNIRNLLGINDKGVLGSVNRHNAALKAALEEQDY